MTLLAQSPTATPASPRGAATGAVRLLLQLEGAAVFVAAVSLYAWSGWSWLLFALLVLMPDLAMLGYLAGPRAGAAAYNLVHTYVPALALTLAGFFAGAPTATAYVLIWLAHIGIDRALGFGLKYPTGFGDTHLSHIRGR